MRPIPHAMHAGLRRGLIELRHTYTTTLDLWGQVFWPLAMLVVLFFLRGAEFHGLSLATLVLPGMLGLTVVFNGLMGTSGHLCVDREDGTLLRARTTPYGVAGYLTGKIVLVTGWVVISVLILLVPGTFLVGGLALGTAGTWLTLAWVVLLGTVAMIPIGAVVGSVMPNPRSQGMIMMPMAALIAVSGIFYPLTALPVGLQAVGQVFPVYWLGLGVRSALLPDEAVAVEVSGSWRHLETVGVLGVWAVAGALVALVVLPRMTRRESGSTMALRREKALRRV